MQGSNARRSESIRNSEQDEPSPFALVNIHSGKVDPVTGKLLDAHERKVPLPMRNESPRVQSLAQFQKRLLEAFNRLNLDHTWKWFAVDPVTGQKQVRPLNPCVRLIYSGSWPRAGRFYSWSPLSGQSLSKKARTTIRIDGVDLHTFLFITPGIRTHLGHNLTFLTAAQIPVTGPTSFDSNLMFMLVKGL